MLHYRKVHNFALIIAFICTIVLPCGTIAKTSQKSAAKSSQLPPPEATPEEIELGKQAANAFEAKEKLVTDKELINRLSEIAKRIASFTERPKINYVVKVIDRQTPNAFTFPGGFVYVTKGLIDLTDSEHEIAAVLAHEIAHNVLRHALRAMEEERKLAPAIIAAIIGATVSSSEFARQLPLIVASLIDAVMLGYSRKFETEADIYGFNYLLKAGFNPVGMLTVFEKLEKVEALKYGGQTLWQAYNATHPGLRDRINWVKDKLNELGIPIIRRGVVSGGKAEVEEEKIGDKIVGVVKVRSIVLCRLASLSEGLEGTKRAKFLAEKLNKLLDAGLRRYEVHLWTDGSRVAIKARGEILLEVTEEDAKLQGVTKQQLAEQWLKALTNIFLAEQLFGSD
ncbi:MAG: M48 family metalloprotease [Armatimonadota bacterium]|nr:M48 family metalloprotease [Armatimonadota bacterium]MCX7776907.1 M48 family metalloprotease [Armatimonadota bacterium]MDW8024407.1 M48 family metalloprotease [Armatimonadota bacterium]